MTQTTTIKRNLGVFESLLEVSREAALSKLNQELDNKEESSNEKYSVYLKTLVAKEYKVRLLPTIRANFPQLNGIDDKKVLAYYKLALKKAMVDDPYPYIKIYNMFVDSWFKDMVNVALRMKAQSELLKVAS